MCRARRGLLGADHFTFFNLSSPVFWASRPQGPFGSWKFDYFFEPFVPRVVPAGAFWELEI